VAAQNVKMRLVIHYKKIRSGTCRLCKTSNVVLADSHLVPPVCLQNSRPEGACIAVNSVQGIIRPTSGAPICCVNRMRDAFQRGGEDWVHAELLPSRQIRMRKPRNKATPFEIRPGFAVYKGVEIPGVSSDHLARRLLLEKPHGRKKRGSRSDAFRSNTTVDARPSTCRSSIRTWTAMVTSPPVSGIMFLLSVGNFVPEHIQHIVSAWATQTGRDGRSHHSNGDDGHQTIPEHCL